MCGIFGIIQDQLDPELVVKATRAIRHRGPNDEGYLLVSRDQTEAIACIGDDSQAELRLPYIQSFSSKRYHMAFGFRRLSILDLSINGHQPMCDKNENIWVMLNGEVYNFVEIRQELIKAGYEFNSGSDTEVILNSYLEWGTECFVKFTGMFAIAIFDRRKHSLILARDPFGIKPLYYSVTADKFAFASEIKSLVQIPWVPREANYSFVGKYLSFGISDIAPETAFNGINALMPGCFLVVDLENVTNKQETVYWKITRDPDATKLDYESATHRFRELFEESVRIHMRSDVPVGVSLSGGLDSSSILETIHHATDHTLGLHAFSFIADNPELCEEKWVDMVCQDTGTISHKTHITGDDFSELMDRMIYSLDEPFGGSSMFAQNQVFQLARQNNVTVLLDGQGSDELLGGYRDHMGDRLASVMLSGNPIETISMLSKMRVKGFSQLSKYFAWAIDRALPESVRPSTWMYNIKSMYPAVSDSWNSRLSSCVPHGFFRNKVQQYSSREILNEQLKYETFQAGLPALLRYEDRNSMAYSIESRVPFLTTGLAQFCLSLPESYKISTDCVSKRILRDAMSDRLPPPIKNRKDKIGFAPPEKEWMFQNSEKVKSIFKSGVGDTVPFFDRAKALSWFDNHLQTGKYDRRIWYTINLLLWTEKFNIHYPEIV